MIGKRIIALRKKHQMTQDQLAIKLDVSRQTISNWENDKSIPDIAQCKEMSLVFGLSIDELVAGSNIKKKVNSINGFRSYLKYFLLILFAVYILIFVYDLVFLLWIPMNNVETRGQGLIHDYNCTKDGVDYNFDIIEFRRESSIDFIVSPKYSFDFNEDEISSSESIDDVKIYMNNYFSKVNGKCGK